MLIILIQITSSTLVLISVWTLKMIYIDITFYQVISDTGKHRLRHILNNKNIMNVRSIITRIEHNKDKQIIVETDPHIQHEVDVYQTNDHIKLQRKI